MQNRNVRLVFAIIGAIIFSLYIVFDTQMMMGPLPGHLTHEVAYLELRTSFAARGRVKFMYLSPSFLDHGGRSVKYGYVVFEEKADAQRILKDGFVTFLKKYQIKLKKMTK